MQDWFVKTTLFLSLIGLLTGAAAAQEDDEESPFRPGLIAAYSGGDNRPAIRIDETVAFDWQDAPPDSRLPAGPFSAVWRGRLLTQSPGEHRLAVFVQGQVTIKLGGKEVLAGTAADAQWLVSATLDLPFDYHPLEITYRRTGERGRLALFWTGPNFVLEPIPERFLFHDRTDSPSQAFERGRQLAAALRCAACHQEDGQTAMPAPALDQLSGNMEREWLVAWLASPLSPGGRGVGGGGPGQESEKNASAAAITRRMPHFGMTPDEASTIAAWLLRLPAEKGKEIEQKGAKDAKKNGKEKKPQPSAEEGEQLFLTLGCLACHQHGTLGESGLFGGGDLTKIAAKRPAEFFARWLADPASLNKHHRMPIFDLSAGERTSLSLWLAQQGTVGNALPGTVGNALRGVPSSPLSPGGRGAGGEGAELPFGEKLIQQFRCAACHTLPGVKEGPPTNIAKPLAAASDWSRSCAGESEAKAHRPSYRLAAVDQAALEAYFTGMRPAEPANRRAHTAPSGRDLLVQLNCLACHQREGIDRQVNLLPARLQDKLLAVAEAHSDLAKQIPAMTPPALNSVGDKLHDGALADAIRRQGEPHRPYLLVRMPKFNLTDEQLAALTAHLVSTDRIPPVPAELAIQNPKSKIQNAETRPMVAALQAAGPRLVTTDGFGCTSCHQVGGVLADQAPINARGPNLSLLEKRIRREWFDRWCYSPARIVPRMEMPSVQVPVRGVLGDNVHDQLAAVWHTLNTPGFEPPEPNPIRVLRLSGVPERKESPIVLHDVIKDGDKTYLFPLVIGLPNRHNILFDLETNRLAAWWLGDTARQRTKGKSWWWEMGGDSIFEPGFNDSEISVWIDGKERKPILAQQFVANLWLHNVVGESISTFLAVLWIPESDKQGDREPELRRVHVSQDFQLRDDGGREIENGFVRRVMLNGEGHMKQVRMRLLSPDKARDSVWDAASRTLTIPTSDITIRLDRPPGVTWDNDGCLLLREDSEKPSSIKNGIRNTIGEFDSIARWQAVVVLDYCTKIPADQFVIMPPATNSVPLNEVAIAPGLAGHRLPLPDNIMPSALTWNASGELLFTTLKGELLKAIDTDGDSHEDSSETIADGLATPYGVSTGDDYIDVAAKDGLLRLQSFAFNKGRFSDWVQTARSGWGCTDDYHDWVVGLVRGEGGEYYLGLPCQQDKRSEAAAKHRGQILKLVPRKEVPNESRLFDIAVLSSGHRFPMGLARNRAGDLFVTDNQGNYNPFNELNHVRPGKHFGFINANEKEAGLKPPPLEEPAINIPHPWTRSVNGICFLDTPDGLSGGEAGEPPGLSRRPTKSIFGPLEGHLIGCEYDTRRLIRMTLQKMGDTYQGAAYPLSIPPDDVEKGLLGPIVCAVSPRGELYVGEIRDSGWGAGNNVGQIVKIKIEPEKLPCGIAEMKATADGFTLDFFQPVDAKKAADIANYSLQSYRRESTPAYGGPDLDRRTEKIAALQVSEDRKRVTLRLPELRERFVYELRLKNLAPKNAMFHPDEAHFTLRQAPK